MKVDTQFGTVDVELFKEQKHALLTVIQGQCHNDGITELLDGLLVMLDELHDKALEPLTDGE